MTVNRIAVSLVVKRSHRGCSVSSLATSSSVIIQEGSYLSSFTEVKFSCCSTVFLLMGYNRSGSVLIDIHSKFARNGSDFLMV